MLFSKNNKTSLITSCTKIIGNIEICDHLEVEGQITGNIQAGNDQLATLRVAEGGHVTGNINVPNIIINGKIEGDVQATGHVELAEKAHVTGTIYYKSIEMIKGAIIEGKLVQLEDGLNENNIVSFSQTNT